jgi:hypothetical protein
VCGSPAFLVQIFVAFLDYEKACVFCKRIAPAAIVKMGVQEIPHVRFFEHPFQKKQSIIRRFP